VDRLDSSLPAPDYRCCVGTTYDAGYFRVLCGPALSRRLRDHDDKSQYWAVMLAQGICGSWKRLSVRPSLQSCRNISQRRRPLRMELRQVAAVCKWVSLSLKSDPNPKLPMGGILYPIVFQQLAPRIGFGWATRVLGFLAMALLRYPFPLCGSESSRKRNAHFSSWQRFANQHIPFHARHVLCVHWAIYSNILHSDICGPRKIMDTNLAFYMLPILNAASIFGRVVPNFFADRTGP
jgi:hypothetical protein